MKKLSFFFLISKIYTVFYALYDITKAFTNTIMSICIHISN